jgi:hypothetical protein
MVRAERPNSSAACFTVNNRCAITCPLVPSVNMPRLFFTIIVDSLFFA